MLNASVVVCMCENEIELLPGEEAGNLLTGDFLLVAFLILQQCNRQSN